MTDRAVLLDVLGAAIYGRYENGREVVTPAASLEEILDRLLDALNAG